MKTAKFLIAAVLLSALVSCNAGIVDPGRETATDTGSADVTTDNKTETVSDTETDDMTSTSDSKKTETTPTENTTAEETVPATETEKTDTSADTEKKEETKDIACPCIVETVYPVSDIIVADIIATNSKYGADPTGQKDSTSAIQKALDDCSANGGGTVFLPVGNYLVTRGIKIPAFVTLCGDYNDPDKGNDYGTVIMDRQGFSTKVDDALFTLGGSAGVRGLTVFYPDQSIDNVRPYPFTFYTDGFDTSFMLSSVQDCTVINGYLGIGACVAKVNPHEQFTIDNVKGTFLCKGAEVYNQCDVGTWKNLYISPKYWAEAGSDYNAPSLEKLTDFMKKNSTGLVLGDLEWTEFANCSVEGCKTGIHIVKGQRIEFAGSLFDFNVSNCQKGLVVDSIDDRWGMVIAKSSISGDVCGIENNAGGVVKMVDVTVGGGTAGRGEIISEKADLSSLSFDYSKSFVKPKQILYVVNVKKNSILDCSAKIQELLDKAGKTGGVVYLPAGRYTVDKPLTVPAGVELLGASSVPTRSQRGLEKGTVIQTKYGMGGDPTDQALITLDGKNSGVCGIRFVYNKNGPTVYKSTPYVIRGKASGVYCVNCALMASSYGIDFLGCDNHFIKKLTSCCYINTMLLGGKNGTVEGCLQNATAIVRTGLGSTEGFVSEVEVFEKVFDPILRKYCEYIKIENADGEKIYNTFCYGCFNFLMCNDSSNISFMNLGSDNIGGRQMTFFKTKNSTGVNIMRWNGESYLMSGMSSVSLYNRLTIGLKYEETVK